MKKTLSSILLGASLIFGAGNVKAQEENVKFYNHDEDEFPEEIICWRKEGFDETSLKPNQNEVSLTIIYYSDKDDDNFYENIRAFNYRDRYSNFNQGYLIIENFDIKKSTGLIDYFRKNCWLMKACWNIVYSRKSPIELITEEGPGPDYIVNKNNPCTNKYLFSLTKEDLYHMGIGERIKKLINASKNEDDLKSMLKQERLRSELLK